MKSTLFTTLTPKEEANLSGGNKKQQLKNIKEAKLIKLKKSKRSKVSVKITKKPNDEINTDTSNTVLIEV